MLWSGGIRAVAGIDEAGRGALAGPVVAAAVVLPSHPDRLAWLMPPEAALRNGRPGGRTARSGGPGGSGAPGEWPFVGVRDSKQLTPSQREAAARVVRSVALAVGVGVVPAGVVDDLGLTFAGQLAFWRAICTLPLCPEHLLVDGFPVWSPVYRQTAVIHGDALCLSIAAASVVAKVERDALMRVLDAEAPGYGWARNCGYATAEHKAALRQLGPSPYHRLSYQPVANVSKLEEIRLAVGLDPSGLGSDAQPR